MPRIVRHVHRPDFLRADRFNPRRVRFVPGHNRLDRPGNHDLAGLLRFVQSIKDVVMEIQNREVGTIKEFEAVMRDILEAQPEIVEIYVQRGYRTHFIFIEPVW